jgi:hypothetical protein
MLTNRDKALLVELATARVLDREQVSDIAGFHSTTRANARLLKLTEAGLLRRFFLPTKAGGVKAIYSLSARGAESVSVSSRILQRPTDSLLVGDQFVQHQLHINGILIRVKFKPLPADAKFLRWLSFPTALSQSAPLIPDGYFEIENPSGVHPMFLEVDQGTESLKVWNKKIEHYLRLATSGEFERLFHRPRFRVLIVSLSDRRQEGIRRTVARQTEKLFWFSTLPTIEHEGLFHSSWLRPAGAGRLSLL